ncbi:hypothetical protein [Polaromonas sp. JS666]|nr:hypothetical protein [Polaromonas sp. JS666]
MQARKFDGVAHGDTIPQFNPIHTGSAENRCSLIATASLSHPLHARALP